MEIKEEILPATYDAVFKSIIQDDDLKDFTAYIIGSIIGRSIDKDSMIFVNTEGTKKTIYDKINVTDVLIDINSNRVALEMNKKNDRNLRERNKAHYYEQAYKTINISYREGISNYFIQINFDNYEIRNKLISAYKLTDIDDGRVDEDNENFIKYRINMAKVYKKYYTLDKELTRFEKAIAILTFNKTKDLRKISKGDDMLMRVVKKLEEFTDNPDLIELISTEKAMEFGHKLDVKEAHDTGYTEGEKNTKIETAKKMLRDNLDVNTICKYTGLSKEEIEKLH